MGVKMSDRKAINKRYDAKRLKKPSISPVRDVPEKTIDKLDFLIERHGSLKQAIIHAINVCFAQEKKETNT